MPATVEGISFAMESGIFAASVIDRHFDRERGLSRAQRELYRARTAARMLPKFWLGEGFVRYMRSESARSASVRLLPVRVSAVTSPNSVASTGLLLANSSDTRARLALIA